MKKIIITLVGLVLYSMSSYYYAYDLTPEDNQLITKISILLQRESPAKKQILVNKLHQAYPHITAERNKTLVAALLQKLGKPISDTSIAVESSTTTSLTQREFDSIYADYLEQMREEDIHSEILHIIENMNRTPADITVDIDVDLDDASVSASLETYIDPTNQKAESSLDISGSTEEMQGSLSLDGKVNDKVAYIKINNADIPDDEAFAEIAAQLSLVEGKRLSIPLEETDDATVINTNTIDIEDMYKELSNDETFMLMDDMLTSDDVRELDRSRDGSDVIVPVKLSSTYKEKAGEITQDSLFNFLSYKDRWYLQRVNAGVSTELIGSDAIYFKTNEHGATIQATITIVDDETLRASVDIIEEESQTKAAIIINYSASEHKEIEYPSDAIDVSGFAEAF